VGRVFVQCAHFANKGEGVLQKRTSAHFGAKASYFRNLWGVRTDKGEGVEPVPTFFEQGERSHFFAILCGCPLSAKRFIRQT